MKINADNLRASLAKGLSPVYLVTGDDPLLTSEACDAVRAKARAAGFTGRELHFVERGFDWSELRASTQSLSLFAERRIVEIRMPGSPGDGAETIIDLANQKPDDILLLIVTDKLDGRALSTKWATAVEQNGTVVQVWPIDLPKLPGWIEERLGRHGLKAEGAAASLIADRVEGNLLAAHQEIEKLALLHPPGPLSAEAVLEEVVDSARYDVLQLGEVAMRGHAARALRILRGLRQEGTELTLVLWGVAKDLHWLARVEFMVRGGQTPDAAMNAEFVWRPRQAAMRQALSRLKGPAILGLLSDAARVDRAIKGALKRDPWLEMEALIARLAGVRLARAA
ncbi:MAG: DNA polymerase III subunit delta [Steroidobacteraceae bacterium]